MDNRETRVAETVKSHEPCVLITSSSRLLAVLLLLLL